MEDAPKAGRSKDAPRHSHCVGDCGSRDLDFDGVCPCSRSATPASRFPATKRPPRRGTPPWPPRAWSPSAFRSLPRPSSSTSPCDRPRLRHARPPLRATSAAPKRRPRRFAATSVSVCRGRSETRPLGATSPSFCEGILSTVGSCSGRRAREKFRGSGGPRKSSSRRERAAVSVQCR